jgi:hypothetical protein
MRRGRVVVLMCYGAQDNVDAYKKRHQAPKSLIHVRYSSLTTLEGISSMPSIAEVLPQAEPEATEPSRRRWNDCELLGQVEGMMKHSQKLRDERDAFAKRSANRSPSCGKFFSNEKCLNSVNTASPIACAIVFYNLTHGRVTKRPSNTSSDRTNRLSSTPRSLRATRAIILRRQFSKPSRKSRMLMMSERLRQFQLASSRTSSIVRDEKGSS